jgi:Family of unknown function (DUF6527)
VKCPDGCGEDVTINLDRRAGKAWRLYQTAQMITVFPSVWRDTGCQSHFIVSRGRIFLFGPSGHEDDEDSWSNIFGVTEEEVLSTLTTDHFESADTISDRLDASPWDVLSVCRRLVKAHHLVEGKGKDHGLFRRLT